MPRYYCDYCKIYLTHDSATGRKQHLRGRQHRDKWKAWYDQYYTEWQKNNPLAHINTTAYGGMGAEIPFHYGIPLQQQQQQQQVTQQHMQGVTPIIPEMAPLMVGVAIAPLSGVTASVGTEASTSNPGTFVPPPSFSAPPNFNAPPPSFQVPPPSK